MKPQMTLALVLHFVNAVVSSQSVVLNYPSGPKAGHPVHMAWGAGTLSTYQNLFDKQISALYDFKHQSGLLVPSNGTRIWDFFPSPDETKYPVLGIPVMQEPTEQNPMRLEATACDTCFGSRDTDLVDLPANSSDWSTIWQAVSDAYLILYGDSAVPQNDNNTEFKMALNWYTYPINDTSSSICSTLYIEGLNGISRVGYSDTLGNLASFLQGFSTDCGCFLGTFDPDSSVLPFKGGWKVLMYGQVEAWRFRIESPGASCPG